MKDSQAYGAAIAWLWAEHARIMDAEREALERLEQRDIEGYRQGLRQKAQLVAGLAGKAEADLERFDGLTKEQKTGIILALEPFSASAETGIALDSPFYMSALLYPDDHRPGEPDNLRLCIERLATENS